MRGVGLVPARLIDEDYHVAAKLVASEGRGVGVDRKAEGQAVFVAQDLDAAVDVTVGAEVAGGAFHVAFDEGLRLLQGRAVGLLGMEAGAGFGGWGRCVHKMLLGFLAGPKTTDSAVLVFEEAPIKIEDGKSPAFEWVVNDVWMDNDLGVVGG